MRILISIATRCAQALYRVMCLASVRRKVVFLSRQADAPSRDFSMLAEALRRRDPNVEIVMRCRTISATPTGRLAYAFEVLAQMRHLATASVCIVDGYIIPVSVLAHRPELTVVQMWHALGAIKRFGLQSVGREGGRPVTVATSMRMHRNYDIVLCGGPGSIPAFAEAFGVADSAVRPLGLPRVDYLLERGAAGDDEPQAIVDLHRRFPRLDEADRVRVLYAPTFRRGRPSAFDGVVQAFDERRFTLIVKPHDLDSAVASGAHVVDASGIDALDLLVLADVVITDYSAIAFEASVLEKPLYFYVPDIGEYRESHGLNIEPLEDMADVSSVDIDDIVRMVEARAGADSVPRAFRERYIAVPQGGCTAAIADLVTGALHGRGR